MPSPIFKVAAPHSRAIAKIARLYVVGWLLAKERLALLATAANCQRTIYTVEIRIDPIVIQEFGLRTPFLLFICSMASVLLHNQQS